ncbi:MAG: hypothetical protein QM617_09220 [Comamonas sp.]
MAIAWMDGFDAIAGNAAALQTWLAAAGFQSADLSDTNTASVEADLGRAIQLTLGTQAGNPSISRAVSGDVAVFSFALTASEARARVCSVGGVDVDWSASTGRLHIGQTIGTDVLILDHRWQFDVVADRAAGTLAVWVNGGDAPQVEASGLTFADGDLAITWGQYGAAAAPAVLLLDDVIGIDANPGQYVAPARMPTRRVFTHLPTADAAAGWDLVAGSGYASHAAAVGQVLADTAVAAALQSNVAGAADLYTATPASLDGTPDVLAVAVTAYARKGDLDDRSIGLALGADGAVTAETPRTLGQDYQFHQAVFEQQPDGSAWGAWPLADLQFGIVAR